MRSLAVACAAFLVPFTILAQDPSTNTSPDYSRDALRHFAANSEIKMSPLPDHLPPGRIQWHIGWMEFGALGMHWRVFYLPIAVPLAGSGLNNVAKIPNPLEMTGPRIAPALQLYPDRTAAVNREMKRVLKMERQAKAKAEP